MAFAYSIVGQDKWGSYGAKWGTFTNGAADEGGDIATQHNSVTFMKLQHTGAAVVANEPVINETFPTTTGDITIVTDAGADGIWMAVGKP